MTLQQYWGIVRRHWKMIVGLFALGLVLGIALSLVMPKKYEATASGFISVPTSQESANFNADAYAKSRAKSYVELGQSQTVADKVASRVGGDADGLLKAVKITAPTNTVTIQVTAAASSPQRSADVANAWITALQEEITKVEGAWKQTGETANTDAVSTLVNYDEATAPSAPSSPKLALNTALGALIGLIVGIALAIALEVFDRRIRNVEIYNREFKAPILGKLPETSWFSKNKKRLLPDETSIGRTKGDATTGFREALRELRTNIQYVDVDNPLRSLVVTSSLPEEGKSTLSANLAVALAQAGETVVLIDGDLRRPTVAGTFGLPGNAGLTDVLAGKAEIGDVLHRWRSDSDLYVLPAGHVPPNPSELLGSSAMADLISELSGYAIVVIDAPPVLPVADAVVLSRKVDGVIISVAAGKTTIDQLRTTLEHLTQVKSRVFGVALNRVPTKGLDSEGYGYYSHKYYTQNESVHVGDRRASLPSRLAEGQGSGVRQRATDPVPPRSAAANRHEHADATATRAFPIVEQPVAEHTVTSRRGETHPTNATADNDLSFDELLGLNDDRR